MKNKDKIFDNNFNEGTLENFSTQAIEIDVSYKNTYLHAETDMYNSHHLSELSDKVYEIIENSEYAHILKNKKVIKKFIGGLLETIFENLKVDGYTFAEKFYIICEVIDIKESIIFENLPPIYKEEAIIESSKYSSLVRDKEKYKLF